MKLYPFLECVEAAMVQIRLGHLVFQQFECHGCKAKQTMDIPNIFYREGECEECKTVTNIEVAGCNYLLVATTNPEALRDLINPEGKHADAN